MSTILPDINATTFKEYMAHLMPDYRAENPADFDTFINMAEIGVPYKEIKALDMNNEAKNRLVGKFLESFGQPAELIEAHQHFIECGGVISDAMKNRLELNIAAAVTENPEHAHLLPELSAKYKAINLNIQRITELSHNETALNTEMIKEVPELEKIIAAETKAALPAAAENLAPKLEESVTTEVKAALPAAAGNLTPKLEESVTTEVKAALPAATENLAPKLEESVATEVKATLPAAAENLAPKLEENVATEVKAALPVTAEKGVQKLGKAEVQLQHFMATHGYANGKRWSSLETYEKNEIQRLLLSDQKTHDQMIDLLKTHGRTGHAAIDESLNLDHLKNSKFGVFKGTKEGEAFIPYTSAITPQETPHPQTAPIQPNAEPASEALGSVREHTTSSTSRASEKTIAKEAKEVAAGEGRQWFQFLTHNAEGKFSGERAAISAVLAAAGWGTAAYIRKGQEEKQQQIQNGAAL